MESTLVAENVFYAAGDREIIKGATIRADKGKVTGLLGRNGSGKSSLLECIFGTKAAIECDVFHNGKKIRLPYAINGLLNFLPQKPFLPPGIRIHNLLADMGCRQDVLLDYFPEIECEIDKRATQLSGGQERLISVLAILFSGSTFSFLDEPFTHITPVYIDRLKQIIRMQATVKGIIITDHMYDHLLDISDRLYLMKDGKSIRVHDKSDLSLHGYLPQASA